MMDIKQGLEIGKKNHFQKYFLLKELEVVAYEL